MTTRFLAVLLPLVLAGCDQISTAPPVLAGVDHTEPVPLTDLVTATGTDTYFGFEGGLYFGTNDVPAPHIRFGIQTAKGVHPLDSLGNRDSNGAIVLMSVSSSSGVREWCHPHYGGEPGGNECRPESFQAKAVADSTLNPRLVVVNGAKDGQVLENWDNPNDANYDRMEFEILPLYGVTPAQVQILWVKVSRREQPDNPSLPDPNADVYLVEAAIGRLVRAAKIRYPNLQQVYLTSRIYGGWSPPTSNSPEPYAFETGFGTKWAIEAQITQRRTGVIDSVAGDLGGKPILLWGPYLWSYGDRPRNDGLIWPFDHFLPPNFIHPTDEDGVRIVADSLMGFFKTNRFTPWFNKRHAPQSS